MNETTNSDSGVETAIPLTFKLPISYLEQKHIHTISEDVTTDLELIVGNSETTEELGMYGHLLQPRTPFAKTMARLGAVRETSEKRPGGVRGASGRRPRSVREASEECAGSVRGASGSCPIGFQIVFQRPS